MQKSTQHHDKFNMDPTDQHEKINNKKARLSGINDSACLSMT